MENSQTDMNETLITLTSDIVAAHVANNSVSVDDLASLINNVYSALSGLGQAVPVIEVLPEPAVSIRASVKPDHIVCLEDGKKLKMLKRHLMTHYNLTPDQYRARWSLPADYPERAAYVVKGSVEADGHAYGPGRMLVFAAGADASFKAVEASTVMLLGGEPVGERYLWWNFVSSSKARIEQAKADWVAGRIPLPPQDRDEFIPLPADPPRPAG